MEEFKVGDRVFVYYAHGATLSEVEKITPAGNIKVNGVMFNKYGQQRGGDVWYGASIAKASEEDITKFKRNVFIKKTLKELHLLKEISYEQAVKIHDILNLVTQNGE